MAYRKTTEWVALEASIVDESDGGFKGGNVEYNISDKERETCASSEGNLDF